jgi:ornithine carbamoyltransferase
VINGLSNYNHSCQGPADLLTILEQKGYDPKPTSIAPGQTITAQTGAHFAASHDPR